MMRLVFLAGLLLVAPVVADKTESKVSPVQKVLQMLEGMKAKTIGEKDAETVEFTTLLQFCKDTNANKGKAIADGTDKIAKLEADILKYDSDAKTLGKEISKLDASTDKAKKDMAASTADHEEEQADYQKLHATYEANIQDIGVAITQLSTMMGDVKAAAASSFIQTMVSKERFPTHAKQVLTAFLATSSKTELRRGGLEAAAPEGAVFESQSGGVVELMEGLKTKLQDELGALEAKNMKAKGAYMVIQQTLTDEIDQHSMMRNHKASTMKEKEAASATAAGDIEDTKTVKAEDEAHLQEVQAQCAMEASEYEASQKLKSGEVTAINKALEILSSGAVSGAADKHLPAAASFAQLRTGLALKHASQSAAASFLQAQGKRMNSRILAALSARVAADPFAKVKKMIEDMINKLMEEANEEAEHKGFCDTEMGTNKMTREQKATDVEELTASIEEMTATIEKLGEDIGELSGRLAETDAAVKEATEIRTAEKEKNSVTIADAVAAKEAVGQALKVLQDFYESASLVQEKATVHTKQRVKARSATGVVGMLEVILSDFERLESDTKQSESANQQEFEKFTNDSNQAKAVLETHVKNKSELKTETDVKLANTKKDLENTQQELDAALAYFEKLKPSCVEAVVSYDDRVARRKEEIESLKEALNILDDSGLSL